MGRYCWVFNKKKEWKIKSKKIERIRDFKETKRARWTEEKRRGEKKRGRAFEGRIKKKGRATKVRRRKKIRIS